MTKPGVISLHKTEKKMNNQKEPAFPCMNVDYDSYGKPESSIVYGGLTKREFLAGLALQGYLAIYAGSTVYPNPDKVAAKAVSFADALLAELDKPTETPA